MNLATFLRNISQEQPAPPWRVVYLCTAEYPALFLSRFLPFLARAYGLPLTVTSVTDEPRVWHGRFTTSFLGMRQLHWCSGLADPGMQQARSVQARAVREFLAAYTGPHVLVAWDGGLVRIADKAAQVAINQEGHLDRQTWDALIASGLFRVDARVAAQAYQASLMLEQACQLLQYAEIAGASTPEVLTEWQERLCAVQQSLFQVSQEFFAKRQRAIVLWHQVRDTYPPEFWTAYWSEQLWQAAHFVAQAQQGVGGESQKRSTNRLPHAFTNGGWRRYTVRELSAAHNALYGVDFASKNGGGDYGLDLFICKFVHGAFERA